MKTLYLVVAGLVVLVAFVVVVTQPIRARYATESAVIDRINLMRLEANVSVLSDSRFLKSRATDLQETVPKRRAVGVKKEHATSADGFDRYLTEMFFVGGGTAEEVAQALTKGTKTRTVLLDNSYNTIGVSVTPIVVDGQRLYSFVIIFSLEK